MQPLRPASVWPTTGVPLAEGFGRKGRMASNITSATPPYTSHNVPEFCPIRFEPSANKPVKKIPSPGPAKTKAPRRGRPAAIASGWLRLVIITSAQALATPVPKRSNRCGQNPWAQYEASVSSTHNHNPPYKRPRTWWWLRAKIESTAPTK